LRRHLPGCRYRESGTPGWAGCSGCAGTIVETTTDTALAIAKVPFKAGGAIIDVIDGDEGD